MNTIKPGILIVDDETSIRESFHLILRDNYRVFSAASGEAALKKIVDSKIDLVFLDIRMPGMNGMETLQRIKEIDDSIEVVMVTAVNDIQRAGEAIRLGANNYIVKPFDIEQILSMAQALVGRKTLKQETKTIREEAKKQPLYPELSGLSKSIKGVTEKIEAFSKKDTPLLIIGENGTEKGSIASQIHSKSERAGHPLKQIEISSNICESDLYAKLFGKGKGSFVVELEKEIGLIEEASGGCILLNNIENAPLSIQEEIANTIKKKEIKRQGSPEPISVNVRIIVSSAKDLKHLTEEGLFSAQLLDCISDCHLAIPPLKERKEDIPYIVNELIEIYNYKHNKNIKELSPDAQEVLINYNWPGNIDELKNLIERLVASENSETIKASDLPFDILLMSTAMSYIEEGHLLSNTELSARFEKSFILQILKRVNFDLKKASQILNISPHMLSSKIEGIEIA